MSEVMFELALKSTLDYHCNKIAEELRNSGDPDLRAIVADGLDNLVTIDANTKTENPAVLWQMSSFMPNPVDPLYSLNFSVGIKTTQDDANYVQSKLVSVICNYFKPRTDFQIFDYSVTVDDLQGQQPVGNMLLNEMNSNAMVFDNQSGFKLVDVSARVVRYI